MDDTEFRRTHHARQLIELRDLLMSAPPSQDKNKAIRLLTEIWKCAVGLYELKNGEKDEPPR